MEFECDVNTFALPPFLLPRNFTLSLESIHHDLNE